MPGPSELAFMVDEPLRRGEVPFSVSADVTVAQRLSTVRHQDWPNLACRADEGSQTIWVNTVFLVVTALRHSWTGCVEVHAASPLLSVGVCRLPSLEFPGKNLYLNPKPTLTLTLNPIES